MPATAEIRMPSRRRCRTNSAISSADGRSPGFSMFLSAAMVQSRLIEVASTAFVADRLAKMILSNPANFPIGTEPPPVAPADQRKASASPASIPAILFHSARSGSKTPPRCSRSPKFSNELLRMSSLDRPSSNVLRAGKIFRIASSLRPVKVPLFRTGKPL